MQKHKLLARCCVPLEISPVYIHHLFKIFSLHHFILQHLCEIVIFSKRIRLKTL